MEKIPHKLEKKISDRSAADNLRTLSATDGLVDFSSNDYLGLARQEGIGAWAGQIVSDRDMVRNGATGSRLLTGNHPLFQTLEALLHLLHEAPALVFNSGYDANIGFFSSVPQRGDVVLFDEYAHASIRDGVRLGSGKGYKFRHNDLKHLGELLLRHSGSDGEVYVVTESVFSMDGDSPDLNTMTDLCIENNAMLVVDEAHALGVFGSGAKGMLQELNLHNNVFARILTFGKAMGTHGAAIAGSPRLKEYLSNFARSFVYTTALPPHSVATVLAAHHFIATEGGQQKQRELRELIDFFRHTVESLKLGPYFINSYSTIHCCILSGNARVKQVSEYLNQKGFDVRPILSPTVPEGKERLRFCLHSFNSRQEIQQVLEELQQVLGTL
jgi:8-amino-7-oxononanoate synthase